VRPRLNTPRNVAALRKRDGWTCQLCREPLPDPPPKHPDEMSVTVDHIVPTWKDGTDDLENLRLAHRICNMRRNGGELSPAQEQRNQKAAEYWAAWLSGKPKPE
ncbi:MAG: HNH endonuclease, partial [Polyangiaceae bacterium]